MVMVGPIARLPRARVEPRQQQRPRRDDRCLALIYVVEIGPGRL